jgi:hypothetical protein
LAPRSLVKTRTTSHLTTRLGIEGVVKFAGSRADVQCAIAELDPVVHASTTSEPVGQVIIEDGLTGMLFPMGDAQAMAEQYSSTRMEAAADRARAGACRCKSVKSILKNSLDQQPLPELPVSPSHDNIRDAEYFE